MAQEDKSILDVVRDVLRAEIDELRNSYESGEIRQSIRAIRESNRSTKENFSVIVNNILVYRSPKHKQAREDEIKEANEGMIRSFDSLEWDEIEVDQRDLKRQFERDIKTYNAEHTSTGWQVRMAHVTFTQLIWILLPPFTVWVSAYLVRDETLITRMIKIGASAIFASVFGLAAYSRLIHLPTARSASLAVRFLSKMLPLFAIQAAILLYISNDFSDFILGHSVHNFLVLTWRVALVSVLSVITWYEVGLVILMILFLIFWRRVSRSLPRQTIIVRMLRILHSLNGPDGDGWRSLSTKRQILKDLEEISTVMTNYLPAKLPSHDQITDIWYRKNVDQMAAAVRNLKKMVLLPASKSKDEFIGKIRNGFVHVLLGNWAALERQTPQSIARSDLLYRARSFARSMAAAFLPLALLWLLNRSSFTFDAQSLRYLTAAGYVWAIISLFLALDPLVSEKIQIMKDVSSLFPFGPET